MQGQELAPGILPAFAEPVATASQGLIPQPFLISSNHFQSIVKPSLLSSRLYIRSPPLLPAQPGAPPSRLMPHTFCFGSVENMLQARRKQIPALKARNSKARGETPGLDGCGTSPARAAQQLCRPCRAKPTFCPRTQGSRARCRVLFHPGLCCAAPSALGCAFCCSALPDYPGSKKYAALAVAAAKAGGTPARSGPQGRSFCNCLQA